VVFIIRTKQNIFLERIDSFYKNKIEYLFRDKISSWKDLVVVIKIKIK